MTTFDPDAKCPKCGGYDVYARWFAADAFRLRSESPDREEHIRRGCRTCGYGWSEAPISATPAPEDDLLSFVRREREKWARDPEPANGLLDGGEMVELFRHLEALALKAAPEDGGAADDTVDELISAAVDLASCDPESDCYANHIDDVNRLKRHIARRLTASPETESADNPKDEE